MSALADALAQEAKLQCLRHAAEVEHRLKRIQYNLHTVRYSQRKSPVLPLLEKLKKHPDGLLRTELEDAPLKQAWKAGWVERTGSPCVYFLSAPAKEVMETPLNPYTELMPALIKLFEGKPVEVTPEQRILGIQGGLWEVNDQGEQQITEELWHVLEDMMQMMPQKEKKRRNDPLIFPTQKKPSLPSREAEDAAMVRLRLAKMEKDNFQPKKQWALDAYGFPPLEAYCDMVGVDEPEDPVTAPSMRQLVIAPGRQDLSGAVDGSRRTTRRRGNR